MNRYRIILALLGLALATVVVGAIGFAPSGTPAVVPDAIEGFSPADGSTVLRQIAIELDFPVDYEIALRVDGIAIPADEIEFTAATGRYTWRPGPGKTVSELAPGIHTVRVRWDRTLGLPDPGEYQWSFRTQ